MGFESGPAGRVQLPVVVGLQELAGLVAAAPAASAQQPGANGEIAASFTAKSPPDGSVFMLASRSKLRTPAW